MTDKPTRPAVKCLCGHPNAFAENRHGYFLAIVCPNCLRTMWRNKIGDPVKCLDTDRKMRELEDIEIEGAK